MELKLRIERKLTVWCLGSNRTFMELKFSILNIKVKKSNGSNRTFMELKLSLSASSFGRACCVLIVPLWN